MSSTVRKLFLLAVPSILLAGLASLVLIEAWVRLSWDDKRGTPGFYVSDPVRGQRLAAGYSGWFAGVPVRTNSLGFRDDRDYTIGKAPDTVRILVLGDSVTFGHGTRFETSYPYLVEQRLKQWRPDVRWEIWNLGVPGYNTGQELSYLQEVGPRYQPDLVVVGFYGNDLTNNQVMAEPSLARRAASAVQRLMQRHLYSYEFYKRAVLTARWRLFTSQQDRLHVEQLANEDALLAKADPASSGQQRLTELDRFTDQDVQSYVCPGESSQTDPTGARELRAAIGSGEPEISRWLEAVRGLQRLHREGAYRIVFFINGAPKACKGDDRFYDAGSFDEDALLMELLGNGTPVVSSLREYLHYRPSQMPGAGGHSVGNANRVKADVLSAFLQSRVLPSLLGPVVP